MQPTVFWLRGCLHSARYVNKVEREMCNYLGWELTIENPILEKLSEIFVCIHLINLNSPLVGRGSKGEAVGVAIQNTMGWGCKWGLVGVGSHLVIDETLGTSRQPGFPLNGGWKRGRGGWGGHPEHCGVGL